MEKIICKECGKIFEYAKISSCKAQLKRHIREEHHMSILEYVVKHDYNGERPVCPCGCGHELNLSQGGDRWKFTKYYADTCYGRLVRSCNEEVLKQYKASHINDFNVTKYYETHYDKKSYKESYELLKSKEYSLTDISEIYKIDKRTLKKVWIGLGITTADELKSLLEYTKYNLSTSKNPKNTDNDEDMLTWLYLFLKNYPGKYTVNSLKKTYNKYHNDNPTTKNNISIIRALHKRYGDEIDIYLAKGFHSSEEYIFYQILKFYLPNYIIKLGKDFLTDDGKIIYYDILIGSRLLLEYDSDGFFHEQEYSIKNDNFKEKFAKENGYIFLRLTKTDIQNIETITKIKNILEDEIN